METPESKSKGKGPIIVGLYGVSGSGKSYLMDAVREGLGRGFALYDGSALITGMLSGGLAEFKGMDGDGRRAVRERALAGVAEECRVSGGVGVVAGHYMFWEDEEGEAERVGTQRDWETYTHIVYLKTDAHVIASRREHDMRRHRQDASAEHLGRWQEQELQELRRICRDKEILLATITEDGSTEEASTRNRFMDLLLDFRRNDPMANKQAVVQAVGSAVAGPCQMKTMLVFDADKTLAPHDTGAMFWADEEALHLSGYLGDPLKLLFKKQGYTYPAFQQAMLFHDDFADEDFEAICGRVAAKVEMFPEVVALIAGINRASSTGVCVVTCGLRNVWRQILDREGLSHVPVFGGGRLGNGYIMTDVAKKQIVDELHRWKVRVVAFGDSPLDIPMLQAADEAYVVVCEEKVRSKSMDEALAKAIQEERLSALQIVLSKEAGYRLDLDTVPRVTLEDVARRVMLHETTKALDRMHEATEKNAAKLLMRATRDASNQGPALRKAHERVGEYLATEYLSDLLGLEDIEIKHVQGKWASGHRIRDEKATLILPAMRGGEPMAFGVNKVLAQASFKHAKCFDEIEKEHFRGKRTIILVDSVINTGRSIVEFVEPMRQACPFVCIVVVAGVIQADAVRAGGRIRELLEQDGNLHVVALRQSENSYKGQGATDTGDRLFNTTYL